MGWESPSLPGSPASCGQVQERITAPAPGAGKSQDSEPLLAFLKCATTHIIDTCFQTFKDGVASSDSRSMLLKMQLVKYDVNKSQDVKTVTTLLERGLRFTLFVGGGQAPISSAAVTQKFTSMNPDVQSKAFAVMDELEQQIAEVGRQHLFEEAKLHAQAALKFIELKNSTGT